jgi:hypothetical protein
MLLINTANILGRVDVSRFGLLRAIFSDNKTEIAVTSGPNHKISNVVRWKNSLSPKGEA